jgi:hypothetical protein
MLEPVQLRRDLSPKLLGIGFGLRVQAIVFSDAANVGMGTEVFGALENAMFAKN